MPAHGGKRRITLPGNDPSCIDVQVAKGPMVDRTSEFAELRRQIDVVDADITLVNKRLDKSQGMHSFFPHLFRKY